MKRRCDVCAREITKGTVLRIGPDRFGPFCKKCTRIMKAEVRKQGMPFVSGRGNAIADSEQFVAKAKEEKANIVCLWDFPESDFARWSKLQQNEHGMPFGVVNNTYAEYQGNLMRLKKGLENEGIIAHVVKLSVQEMVETCHALGLPYSSRGRSAALAYLGSQGTF